MSVITSKSFFRPEPSPTNDDAICVRRDRAAALLGISTSSLDRLVKAGEIPCVKLAGRVLFRPDTLRDWAKQRETRISPAPSDQESLARAAEKPALQTRSHS